MKKKVIVFDFDKTMTEKDTILGFYRFASRFKLSYSLKLPIYYLFAILTKMKFKSNMELKRLGVRLFLNGLEKEYLEKVGIDYSSEIKMNDIYRTDFFEYPVENVLVMSASYEVYLNPLFPNHRVVGSLLSYDSSLKVSDLLINMYGERKQEWLNDHGIDEIDLLYTDSFSDKPLMDISKNVFLVKNGEKEMLKHNNTYL